MRQIAAVFVVFALAACTTTGNEVPVSTAAPAAPKPAPQLASHGTVGAASVTLAPASGSQVGGKLGLSAFDGGVHVVGTLSGLPANSTHGFHIHAKGDCSAADAASAGGHLNPMDAAHGRAEDAVHHLGDIDNIVAGSDGVARVDAEIHGVVLGGGADNDIVGKAFIVHAGVDDYVSQPAGNSGARVACGVIVP